jgi:hypothetical protein
MEATGIYWKPMWHVLEGSFELVLGNTAHIRNVHGRKPMRTMRAHGFGYSIKPDNPGRPWIGAGDAKR